MRKLLPLTLILLAGCASSGHDQQVEKTSPAFEHEAHDHHCHPGSNNVKSDNIGQDILEDVESGFISGIFQAIFDAIFHRDD